jgi:S1-C subfamily serine protease
MLEARRRHVDRLLDLSDQLAAAAQRVGQWVLAVHGRPRVPSTGIHWRSGLIVTANHTLQTDDDLSVTRPTGESSRVTVVGRDPGLDIAILRGDDSAMAVAEVGDSDAVRVGHMVLALGAGPRASWGVISAIGAASSRRADGELFSLDLRLYPGFSGGPLVDARGSVVGVNTSGASRHLHLAIPANAVNRVVDAVVRHGRVPQAYLGVSTQQIRVPEGVGEQAGVGRSRAVIVVEVQSGSPAAAGLLVGDVILALDGIAIADPLDLRGALRPERIGQPVTASVLRAGRVIEVSLTVGERPDRGR